MNARVLLIEDNPQNRYLVQFLLEAACICLIGGLIALAIEL